MITFVVSGFVTLYCSYLLIFRRDSFARKRPWRSFVLTINPLIYGFVFFLMNARMLIDLRYLAIGIFSGFAFGIWRAQSISIDRDSAGKIWQTSNWTGIIPIFVLSAIWPFEFLFQKFVTTSPVPIISSTVLWFLFANSVSFVFVQWFRAMRLKSLSETEKIAP